MRLKGIWRFSFFTSVFVLIILIAGCSHIPRPRVGTVETGTASWYGEDFHGKPTASGQIYDMYGFSAAHKTIPLGSQVRVTNLANGKQVIVPIMDRGPFVGDRVIDLSYGAAQRLEMIEEGLAKVRIEVLEIPRSYRGGRYTLQFGAFAERDNARKLADKLESKGYRPDIEETNVHGDTLYRVRLGLFNSIEGAQSLEREFSSTGITCFIVAL
jgi:rare lipoprotein A